MGAGGDLPLVVSFKKVFKKIISYIRRGGSMTLLVFNLVKCEAGLKPGSTNNYIP